MMHAAKNWIEAHFNICLALAFVGGLVIPGLDVVPDTTVVFMTAILIYLACSRITPDELHQVDVVQLAVFCVARFMVFPFVLFFAARFVVPDLAPGVLLLMLMPAGVAVAALSALNGGNVSLGLALTVVSSLLAPAIIPSAFGFTGSAVNVDTWSLFLTLILIVFLPILLYFGAAVRMPRLKALTGQASKAGTILLLCVMMAIVLAKKRAVFFEEPVFLMEALAVLAVLFAAGYGFGWLLAWRQGRAQQISFAVGSGAMNNALGIGLALVYFDDKTSLFMVLSEVVWIASLVAFQAVTKRKE